MARDSEPGHSVIGTSRRNRCVLNADGQSVLVVIKVYMRFIECLKLWRATQEPAELWMVEFKSPDGVYIDRVEQRGIDPGHEVLQVFANPVNLKIDERGEDNACWRRHVSEFRVRGRLKSVMEVNGKIFEVGQHGQTGDERLG